MLKILSFDFSQIFHPVQRFIKIGQKWVTLQQFTSIRILFQRFFFQISQNMYFDVIHYCSLDTLKGIFSINFHRKMGVFAERATLLCHTNEENIQLNKKKTNCLT